MSVLLTAKSWLLKICKTNENKHVRKHNKFKKTNINFSFSRVSLLCMSRNLSYLKKVKITIVLYTITWSQATFEPILEPFWNHLTMFFVLIFSIIMRILSYQMLLSTNKHLFRSNILFSRLNSKNWLRYDNLNQKILIQVT